jgi:hypothetical protein
MTIFFDCGKIKKSLVALFQSQTEFSWSLPELKKVYLIGSRVKKSLVDRLQS